MTLTSPPGAAMVLETTASSRSVKPIKWFATAGAFFLGLQGYVFTRWILSGNAVRTPPGSDPIPSWMSVAAHTHEILSVLLFGVSAYCFLVRPWRRHGRLGLHGLLFFACLSAYWQDLGANYFNHIYTYNSALINFGAWYNFIPGWVSPRANHISEAVVFTGPAYVWCFLVPAMGIAFIMRKAKSRWPQLGTVGLILVSFAANAIFDLALETFWVHLGIYTFTGTIPWLTLGKGHYYQFPLYEPLIIWLYFGALASLLYFRDDKGNTLVERGVDTIRVSASKKTWLRFLALSGFVNVIVLAYNVFFAVISLFPGFSWNADVVTRRSYLRDQLCGSGTTYACPGQEIPIPRRGGAHVSPDGTLVFPSEQKVR